MSRFNSEAYDRLFPRVEEQHTHIESAVPTFTPTADIENNSVVQQNEVTVETNVNGKEIEDGNDGNINPNDN